MAILDAYKQVCATITNTRSIMLWIGNINTEKHLDLLAIVVLSNSLLRCEMRDPI